MKPIFENADQNERIQFLVEIAQCCGWEKPRYQCSLMELEAREQFMRVFLEQVGIEMTMREVMKR